MPPTVDEPTLWNLKKRYESPVCARPRWWQRRSVPHAVTSQRHGPRGVKCRWHCAASAKALQKRGGESRCASRRPAVLQWCGVAPWSAACDGARAARSSARAEREGEEEQRAGRMRREPGQGRDQKVGGTDTAGTCMHVW